ncbi:hypothetical protein ACK8HX_01890 [Oryzobacter sp. R7]|uniref:hypothetical protein n=1 Tax=Oryzobacter faecalis TaxID=3388656 RepID=UPI00398CF72C
MTSRFLVAEAAHSELPMPPWVFGVLALVAFAFLLGVTWSFRGTAQKYVRPNTSGARHGESHIGPNEVSTGDADPHWPEHPGHQH